MTSSSTGARRSEADQPDIDVIVVEKAYHFGTKRVKGPI